MRLGVRLLHEDDDILVIDKPAGLLTSTVGDQQGDSAFALVKEHVRARSRGKPPKVWIIHRLDKEASGLLIFAKSETAYGVLKEEFRTRRVHRIYATVVEGQFDTLPGGKQMPAGTVQSYLYEDERGHVHSVDSPSALPRASHARGSRGSIDDSGVGVPRSAVTHYRVLAQGHGRALLQVRLETGRKHQIRVHMRVLGKPIVGDRRYGATSNPVDRLCLHATELACTHPSTGQSLRWISPMPGSFRGLVGAGEQEAPGSSEQSPSTPAPVASVSPAPAPIEPTRSAPQAAASGWDHVADWYDQLLDQRGSDHHERVVLPGTLRLLAPEAGQRVLDVACGQGVLARRLGAVGVRVTGVDGSEKLIGLARAADSAGMYVVGDARSLDALPALTQDGPFDAAACVLALMNIEPISGVVQGIANLLRPGGVFVAVILHPAFRSPGQTSWGWDQPRERVAPSEPGQAGAPSAGGVQDGRWRTARGTGPARRSPAPRERPVRDKPSRDWSGVRQYRRVDAYLSPAPHEVVMNPGAVAGGKEAITTTTYHRPLQAYVRACAEAGLLIDTLEEWPSTRVSEPGPRAEEENRARREFPMFAALRARKV